MPYQCDITLKYSQAGHIVLFKHVKTRYFLLFCVVGEVYYVVAGNEIILGIIVNYVINCYYHVMIIEVVLIFC